VADEPGATPDPAGEALARNIKRVREGQRLTYVEVAERLKRADRPIPVLGLRRIERGERRVDVADLLALSYVLGVTPVDLLIPGDADDAEPYSVTPNTSVTAGAAREWVAGRLLAAPKTPAEIAEAFRWMPKKRAQELSREWFAPERIQEWNRAVLEYDDAPESETPAEAGGTREGES
jgi:transcriptional regulator with XRE-family HTH domain